MSDYPYPPYPQTPLNPHAPPFHSNHHFHQSRMTHPSQHYQMNPPQVRNGVYQYPPSYHNLPSPIYSHGPPTHYHALQSQLQRPHYPTPHPAAISTSRTLAYPPLYAQAPPQPESKPDTRRHHRHHDNTQTRKDDRSRRFDIDEAQRALPPAQRGYRPRHDDIITTYYPKTLAQIAYENEVQARRDGVYAASCIEPEDRAPDRRWEVIYADGDRDYLTFAQIKNGFPGGEWRATETGQWRYHIGSVQGARHGVRPAVRGWNSGVDEDDGGKKADKGSKGRGRSRKKGRRDESSEDDGESSESEVTSEHIRRWRAAWDDKY